MKRFISLSSEVAEASDDLLVLVEIAIFCSIIVLILKYMYMIALLTKLLFNIVY